jgi:DNA primase
MAFIPDDKIQEVRSKADIVSIIGQYIPLTKKGKNYMAVCPFHDDHNPSMSISPDKQIYKCFVCHAGGNVFTFVSEFEKISFVDAVLKVAKEVNVYLGDVGETSTPIDPIIKKHLACLNDANQYLTYQLHAQDGFMVKEYLKNRGLSDAIIERFNIGYNPPKDAITTFLLAKKHDAQTIEDTNVGINSNGKLRDVFSDRVTFPIYNYKGQLIGFTARALLDHQSSKYINTATTKLYTKSEVVYNLSLAKDVAKKEGYLILVEGVMDVLAYARAGIFSAVSTLGTALTSQQIDQIKRVSHHVVLSFDYDEAGLMATYQAIESLVNKNMIVEVVKLPDQSDPDDLILKEGEEALVNAVESRSHWMEFVLFYGQKLYRLSNYQQKKKYINLMISHIKKLNETIDRKHFATLLAKISEMDVDEIYQAVAQVAQTRGKIVREQQQVEFLVPLYEKEILAQMLLSKQAAIQFQDDLGYLTNTHASELAMMLISLYRHVDVLEIADVLSKAQEVNKKDFVLWLMDWALFPKQYESDVFEDAIVHVKAKNIEDKIAKLKRLATSSLSQDEKATYINQMIDAQKEIHKLHKKESKHEDI